MTTPSFSGSTRGASSGEMRTRANSMRLERRDQLRERQQPSWSYTSSTRSKPQARATLHRSTPACGVARLHAGFAVESVVEHDDERFSGCARRWSRGCRCPSASRRRRSPPARGRFGCASARPRPIIAAPPMRAPEIEVAVMIAGGGDVVGRASRGRGRPAGRGGRRAGVRRIAARQGRASFHEHLAADQALRQQHGIGAVALEGHVAGGAPVAPTSSGCSARTTCDAHDLERGSASRPIGTCQGLNSPHSPRIVTSVSNGKRQASDQRQHVDAVADAARLHQQRGALAAEPGAGDQRDAFLLGGQHDVGDGRVGLHARSAACGRRRAHSRPGGCRRA